MHMVHGQPQSTDSQEPPTAVDLSATTITNSSNSASNAHELVKITKQLFSLQKL